MNQITRKLALSGLTFLFLGFAAGAAADQGSEPVLLDASQVDVIPVLVSVNSRGKVINVEPPMRLRAAQQRQLEATINKMIVAPARNKKGQNVASQFVMTMAMAPVGDDPNVVSFAYLGAKAVQLGPMLWVETGPAARQRWALAPYPGGETGDPAFRLVEQRHAAMDARNQSDNWGTPVSHQQPAQ